MLFNKNSSISAYFTLNYHQHFSSQLRRIAVVPPLATLFAKSPEVDKYAIKLDDIIVGAAPIGAEIEDLLIQRFPGVKIRQGES